MPEQQSMGAEPGRIVRETKVWTDGDISVKVPVGPCTFERASPQRVLLRWSEGGSDHLGWVPPERFRELLADGDCELAA